MKIRKMTATFGRLVNEQLELSPGLNIIEAPNERGKSTWCGFISAMLYGVDTSERDRAGRLSAKSRFKPWSGADMAGRMELTSKGRELTIERTSRGGAMKGFIAVHTGTMDAERDITGENAGEEIAGATREVFERTAFISRPEMRVSQTSELEKRIASLVSTGNEDVSFTDTNEKLRAWQRRIRFNRSGTIPALEDELKSTKRRLDELEASAEEIAGLRGSMERYQKQIDGMERDLVTHDKLEHRAAAHRYWEARDSVSAAEQRVKTLREAITKNGHEMTREDIKSIRDAAGAVMPLRKVSKEAEKRLWQAEKDVADAGTKCASSPLAGKNEAAVRDDIERARALEEKLRTAKDRRLPKILPPILIAIAVIGMLFTSGVLLPFTRWAPGLLPWVEMNVWGIVGFWVLLAVGVALMFIKLPRRKQDADELQSILDRYGMTTADRLRSALDSYSAVCRAEEAAKAARDSARAAYEDANRQAEAASAAAVKELSAFMPEVQSGEQVQLALAETEENIERLTKAELELAAARGTYETLSESFDDKVEVDESYLAVPLRSREDTVTAIERAKAQLANATRDFHLATGAQSTLGDPAVVRGELDALTERIADETEKYNALATAIDALTKANEELQTRFSPVVSRRAGEIMQRLTDGKYEKLLFDKSFNAGAQETGGSVERSVLALSEGTADEVYFSLRLAMCELILGGEDPCPIVLDGALESFDDTRCREALDLLLSMADTRQIIVFTCHHREAEMVEGAENARVIRLS